MAASDRHAKERMRHALPRQSPVHTMVTRRSAPVYRPLIGLAAGLLAAATVVPAADRPNILIFFSDDHAAPAISAYADDRRLIETPGIDRIARAGMRFERCLVPSSICGPSRASLLTGVWPHIHGFTNNQNCRFDGSQPTFPQLIRAAGYRTALIGKWHLVSQPTGFDHVAVLPGQGKYYQPPMVVDGARIVETGHVTDAITRRSLAWLAGRDRSQPYLLMVNHKAPHRTWQPQVRHLGHDGDRVYPEPPTFFDSYQGRAAAALQTMSIARDLHQDDLKLRPPEGLAPEERDAWNAYYEPRNAAAAALSGEARIRWQYQRYLHDYLACVRGVDESVGSILDAIERDGTAERTLVIYASDQGFFLGEHGWYDKRWIYEESLRTPLLVRWPGHVPPDSMCDRLVSVADLAPTLLAAAGLPAHPRMQGYSLLPLFTAGPDTAWRTACYYQYLEYPFPHSVRPHEGVVTDRYKLVRFFGADAPDAWELFDRSDDPLEMRNRAGDPALTAVQANLAAALAKLRAELEVPDDIPHAAFGGRAGPGDG
jgi:arylsulfatase A-like enzyme